VKRGVGGRCRTDRAMPNRLAILLALFSLGIALAACHSSTSAVPTPAPSSSFTPNPAIKNATVEVTILGSPTPAIPVEISTPHPYPSGRPGEPFKTNFTNKKGFVGFSGLKPSGTYCWVAILGSGQTSSTCQSWAFWQTTTITLGT
jgi:hypothetical protein